MPAALNFANLFLKIKNVWKIKKTLKSVKNVFTSMADTDRRRLERGDVQRYRVTRRCQAWRTRLLPLLHHSRRLRQLYPPPAVLLLFFLLFSYYLFLTIPIRSIVSKSTRPIFPNFFRFGRTVAVVCKSAPRSRQITTPAPTTPFLQAGCPSCRPTNSVKALKANRVRITTFNLRYDTIRDAILTCARKPTY